MSGAFYVTPCRRCGARTDAQAFACVFCGLAFVAVIPRDPPPTTMRRESIETGRAITTVPLGESIL